MFGLSNLPRNWPRNLPHVWQPASVVPIACAVLKFLRKKMNIVGCLWCPLNPSQSPFVASVVTWRLRLCCKVRLSFLLPLHRERVGGLILLNRSWAQMVGVGGYFKHVSWTRWAPQNGSFFAILVIVFFHCSVSHLKQANKRERSGGLTLFRNYKIRAVHSEGSLSLPLQSMVPRPMA